MASSKSTDRMNSVSSNHEESRNSQHVSVESPPLPDLNEDLGPEELHYKVWETPPIHLCILLGFQHYISMFIATLTVPFLLAPVLCLEGDNVGLSEIIGTLFVASGLITLLQTIFGIRLPIVQAGTFALMAPTIAFFSLPEWECPAILSPDSMIMTNITEANTSMNGMIIAGSPEHREIWMFRIRVIQGSLMVAALFEFSLGVTGLVGVLLRFIGPLSICPTISLLGLSLFKSAAGYGGKQWWICLLTIGLMVLFSQYLGRYNIPCFGYTKETGCVKQGYPLLRMFPVMLGIIISWFVSYILTVTNVFPNKEGEWGYGARTDLKLNVIYDSPWIRIPYPAQWGSPQVSISCTFGLLAGIIATTVESVGDYHACARLSGAPPPPKHAINRGIMIEGLGSFLDGLFGTGNGTTSTSINVGVVGITKVGSRRVVQYSAFFMIALGIFTKFGALFVTVPDPVIGGAFFILFGLIIAVGISNLQYVDLNSSRNLFIIGFSFLMGLALPEWIKNPENHDAVNIGNDTVDRVITVLLSIPMFVGGMTGFIFDNTIPGTAAERGLAHWQKLRELQDRTNSTIELEGIIKKSYDLPFGNEWLRSKPITRWLPFCPSFGSRKPSNRAESDKLDKDVESVNLQNHSTVL